MRPTGPAPRTCTRPPERKDSRVPKPDCGIRLLARASADRSGSGMYQPGCSLLVRVAGARPSLSPWTTRRSSATPLAACRKAREALAGMRPGGLVKLDGSAAGTLHCPQPTRARPSGQPRRSADVPCTARGTSSNVGPSMCSEGPLGAGGRAAGLTCSIEVSGESGGRSQPPSQSDRDGGRSTTPRATRTPSRATPGQRKPPNPDALGGRVARRFRFRMDFDAPGRTALASYETEGHRFESCRAR